jgi:hypothetical protein
MDKAAQEPSGSIRNLNCSLPKLLDKLFNLEKRNRMWAESGTCGSHRNQTGTQQPIIYYIKEQTRKKARSKVY